MTWVGHASCADRLLGSDRKGVSLHAFDGPDGTPTFCHDRGPPARRGDETYFDTCRPGYAIGPAASWQAHSAFTIVDRAVHAGVDVLAELWIVNGIAGSVARRATKTCRRSPK
jgi:hypothetical protein